MKQTMKQKAIVKEGGRIEIFSPQLPAGTLVDILIQIESTTPKKQSNRFNPNKDKAWLKSIPPINVGLTITDEWLFEAKCEGRE